ncbi:MAG: tautomerase family protein [Methanomicrobiales archaeon]|nr:tautomerase family protein [Methanomicrobiales archaeon]
MPVVQLTLREGRSKEQIKRAIEGISSVICTEIGVEPKDVTVLVTELPATHIGKFGTTLSATKPPQDPHKS